ncbi:MAG: type II toxin-antitoxin system VapC family toxin [Acidobacteria bacterium]|nr:type II toxin-antitoxin system VapC family toxin [Acidobacteriota bacterium]
MGLIDDLGSGPVGLDTPPFIYFIEEHKEYLAIVRPLFAAMTEGRLRGVVSALTLLETLVLPYRSGNAALAGHYEGFLTRSSGLRMHGITVDVLRAAAQLRAVHNIRTPDAIHLATAMIARCPVYLTNDRNLPSIPGIRILQVKSYLLKNATDR